MNGVKRPLTLKAPKKKKKKKLQRTTLKFFYFYILKKIRFDVLSEFSAMQVKYQVLFSLKNNEEIFMNVICCSCESLALSGLNTESYASHA